jgi:hypothetical protein
LNASCSVCWHQCTLSILGFGEDTRDLKCKAAPGNSGGLTSSSIETLAEQPLVPFSNKLQSTKLPPRPVVEASISLADAVDIIDGIGQLNSRGAGSSAESLGVCSI